MKDWNVIALILDSPHSASPESANGGRGFRPLRRVKDSVVERHIYTPYGELQVHQETAYGDYHGDGDVDESDRQGASNNCSARFNGACRIMDLDFDGDYDATDSSLRQSLPQGLARHPGKTATAVEQPFGHQGLLYEPVTCYPFSDPGVMRVQRPRDGARRTLDETETT